MDTDEVIEIGEDGQFEIPKSKITVKNIYTNHTTTREKISLEESPVVNVLEVKETSLLDSVSAGEYKIFRNKVTAMINIIICLKDDEQLKLLNVAQNAVYVELENGKELHIPLSLPVISSTALSKVFQKYITIQIGCL